MDFADGTPRKESPVDSAALLDGLLRVSQAVRLRFNDWLGRFQLNDGRHAVLVALADAGDTGCSQAELAVRLGQSESNISTLIERMQRDGLVNRLRSEADRRKRVLSITATGRYSLTCIDANRSSWAGRMFQGISAEELSRLFSLLQKLGTSLETPLVISHGSPDVGNTSRGMLASRELSVTEADPLDPIRDPQSPQFALQKMLLALSTSAAMDSNVKDVA